MRMANFAGFDYVGLLNVGDHIQSVATEQHLPDVVERFNRDTLSKEAPLDKLYLIMNGWFSHSPETCLPTSANIVPIFWGFHLTNWNDTWKHFLKSDTLLYLKRYEPIGCRDPYTALRLKEAGVETFVSRCLTLTFPKRTASPLKGLVFVVDAENLPLPSFIKEQAFYCTHTITGFFHDDVKRIYARYLLYLYERRAALVITTRLHCLLPCIAMGIPVIFFAEKSDYRVSWVSELGVTIYTKEMIDGVDWHPAPIPFEEEKALLIKQFRQIITEATMR